MKQRSGRVSSTSTSTSSENEVAAILLELQTLIFEFPFTWGRKRKRSAIAVTSSSESPFPPPLSKSKAASPITPLSFSPSDYESDDHPTRIKRNNVSIKRKREQCLKVIEEITNANNLLYGEVKNVQSYFDQLKNLNLKLKERQQELSLGPNQGNAVHKQLRLKFPGTAQHGSLIANRTTVPPQISVTKGVGGGQATTSFGVTSLGGSGFGIANTNSYDVGPTGIPDLNIPLEEPVHQCMVADSAEGLDVNVIMANKNLSRAMATLATKQNPLFF